MKVHMVDNRKVIYGGFNALLGLRELQLTAGVVIVLSY